MQTMQLGNQQLPSKALLDVLMGQAEQSTGPLSIYPHILLANVPSPQIEKS